MAAKLIDLSFTLNGFSVGQQPDPALPILQDLVHGFTCQPVLR